MSGQKPSWFIPLKEKWHAQVSPAMSAGLLTVLLRRLNVRHHSVPTGYKGNFTFSCLSYHHRA